MKILVLSVATGGGHLTASKAITTYLKEKGHDSLLVDTYEYIAPALNTALSKGYLASTKFVPEVYGLVYKTCEKKDIAKQKIYAIKTMNSVLKSKFAKLVVGFNPDVIVCTHVMAAQLVDVIRKKYLKKNVATIGIITDFTFHPYWEDTNFDYYVTATELLNLRLMKRGIKEEQIKPFGIPVDSKFSNKLTKEEARKELGIANKRTILVMSGSMGYGKVIKQIKRLDTLDEDFQIIVVCGTNNYLKKRVEHLVTRKTKYVYGFTDMVHIMMDACDCIVTKPGGLTISEALAKEIPIILSDPIPGQEDRNLEFLLNNAGAQAISHSYPIDEAVYELMCNSWRIESAKANVKNLSKPNATKDLCDFIISLEKQEK